MYPHIITDFAQTVLPTDITFRAKYCVSTVNSPGLVGFEKELTGWSCLYEVGRLPDADIIDDLEIEYYDGDKTGTGAVVGADSYSGAECFALPSDD